MGSFAHGGDDMIELTHCCGRHVAWIGGINLPWWRIAWEDCDKVVDDHG